MNERFELCEQLIELLETKEALADLKKLYERHKEMFKDIQEVKQIIEMIVKSPEIIFKNPKAKQEKDFIVAKQVDSKKIGDIGIRSDDNISVIFHANKKNTNKFKRYMKNKQVLVETPSSKC